MNVFLCSIYHLQKTITKITYQASIKMTHSVKDSLKLSVLSLSARIDRNCQSIWQTKASLFIVFDSKDEDRVDLWQESYRQLNCRCHYASLQSGIENFNNRLLDSLFDLFSYSKYKINTHTHTHIWQLNRCSKFTFLCNVGRNLHDSLNRLTDRERERENNF